MSCCLIIQSPRLFLIILTVVSSWELSLDKWQLQNSAKVSSGGQDISKFGYPASSWYPVSIPCTVLAGLVQNGLYKDPFYSKNLNAIPTKQFNNSWWYRTEWIFPSEAVDHVATLTFKGINYRANIWFNGKKIANQSTTVGTFRYFDFSLTLRVKEGDMNSIAVEVFRPFDRAIGPGSKYDTDLAISFVDWAPYPPDGNMGLWQKVVISLTSSVAIRYPQVTTDISSLDLAHLTVMVDLSNNFARKVNGILTAEIPDLLSFQKEIQLESKEMRHFIFDNDTFSVLNVKQPSLWWPWQMGQPKMYNFTFTFREVENQIRSSIITTLTINFGMRQVTSTLTEKGDRLFKINNLPILIRGGGWSPDLFQRSSPIRQVQEFNYVRALGLNTIRLEGKMENDHFFDLADEYGILVMPGWCCCDAWQHWPYWQTEQHTIAIESLRSQIRRMRIHPSVFVFVYSSDTAPPTDVEAEFLEVFKEEYWTLPTLAAASNRGHSTLGPTGVKMSGPYAWVPPNYWLLDEDSHGGAFGFNTETSPGGSPLTLESLIRTIPQDDLWPMDSEWDYHCGNPHGIFSSLKFFTPALNARYGEGSSAADYLEKAQVMAYESHRAMFEAYSRNKYTSTGIVQWMLNNAWPEMIWHLYDYYLNPGGAYFGVKKALEPLHIQYSYNDRSVWIVNSLYQQHPPVKASAYVYTLDGELLYQQHEDISLIESDTSTNIFTLPSNITTEEVYFIKLVATNSSDDAMISRNWYWLSKKVDVLEWENTTFYRTPCSSFANLTSLQSLPHINLNVSVIKTRTMAGRTTSVVRVINPSDHIAFFIRLRFVNPDGIDVLPILWDDNYITLLPSEIRDITVRFEQSIDAALVWEVWNNISGGK